MKLIRLVSKTIGNDAIFENYFSTYIQIKPQSQIALDTLALDLNNETLSIDNTNKMITFSFQETSGDYAMTTALSKQTYDQSNIAIFFEDFQNSLCSMVDIILTGGESAVKNLGIEWFVFASDAKNGDYKMAIGFDQSPLADYLRPSFNKGEFGNPDDFWFSGTVGNKGNITAVQNGSPTTHPWCSLQKTTSGSIGEIKANYFFNKCGGFFRVNKITITNNEGDADTNGFAIFIRDETDNFVIGIRCNRASTVYQYSVDDSTWNDLQLEAGSPVNTSLVDGSSLSDVIEIRCDADKFIFALYQATGKLFFQHLGVAIDRKKKYYGGIRMYGDSANCVIDNVTYSVSYLDNDINNPARLITTLLQTQYLDTQFIHGANLQLRRPEFDEVDCQFEFHSEELAEALGYDDEIVQNDTKLFKAYSKTYFPIGSKADNYIVQCNNLQLKSYDGKSMEDGQRRSILALIPADNSNQQVLYKSSQRVFLDIDNKQELNLNKMSISILDDNYNPIKLNKLSSLSLLIKDRNESI